MHGNALDDGRVVHKDVHRPQLFGDIGEHLAHLRLVRDVAHIARRLDARLAVRLDGRVPALGGAAVERDLRARFRERHRDAEPDSVRSSRDQGHLTVDPELIHCASLLCPSVSVPIVAKSSYRRKTKKIYGVNVKYYE